MDMKIPQKIISGIDGILNTLAESRKLKGYRSLIGNHQGAYLKEYDDSQWNFSSEPVKYDRHQGTTWFRFDITAPEKVMDIPVAGAGMRLSSFFTAPIDIYVDGELKFSERTWMDFKIPEIILTENAISGQVFKIAAKMEFSEYCYFNGNFSMSYIIDKVEDMEFEINSFKEELAYGCRFEEVRDILPRVFDLIADCLEKKEDVLKLAEKIKLSREMLKPMEAKAKEKTVHLIGHAHIDMNWFWSIEETHDLIRRDFGTMTQIMEEIPEFRFSQSQCATYEMAEKLYPDIFERMKKCIKAGKWDVTASTWVEGDMNMSSGEAIVRHLLYSKKYLWEKFGVEPKIMWCPDTFGHSGNVPQIAKKAGIDYYFFTRCGEQSRELGADVSYFIKYCAEKPIFWWEGIDGSRILAYNMVYGSDMNTASVLNIARKLEDKNGLNNSMYIYGTGDHGGGPTRRDIKRAKQLDSYPTTPKVKFSTTHSFFDSVVKENVPSISIEKGELNFIFDGCYTTHADIKKYNRKGENMLIGTEILATAGSLYGLPYEKEELEDCWKTVLFNQFHDIFDGSGVKATYAYASETAEKALGSLEKMTEKYIKAIGKKIKTSDKGIPVILFNTIGWERNEYVKLNLPESLTGYCGAVDNNGTRLPTQFADGSLYVYTGIIPSIGYKVIYLNMEEYNPVYNAIKDNGEFYEIDTKYYRIEIKKNSGEITTLFDRINGRHIVNREQIGWRTKNGILNTLQIHNEVPVSASSWTIGPSSSIKCLVSGATSTIKTDGPIIKVINFRHEYGNSVISQDITIYDNSPRIDFVTHVDWKETGNYGKEAPMLKACFTPDIDNRYASYEIPFGAIDRPCKDIEVPALKWIDISDGNNGFSLMNDCKYGHKVKGNSMEITLLRSGWEPDPESDVGIHEFVYSIFPHKGNWEESDTVKQGYCLNNAVITGFIESSNEGYLPEIAGLVRVDRRNMAISAFKPAESGEGLILRLYNGSSTAEKVRVELDFDIERVYEVDLNENKTYRMVGTDGKGFEFDIDGFEIKTFKLFNH
ncbi:MAG: glycoside hydrolase family 38 C-terminal domain-containing protein [Clostridiales bacterium]|nr:glycoside hydrolase family 38 C-terminal domain-containing protein [Clostridiales bacterium]